MGDRIRAKLHEHKGFQKYVEQIPILLAPGSVGGFSSSDPWLDMATLTEAGLTVANCVSVFSYIAALMRKNQGRPTVYFGGEHELVAQRPFLDEEGAVVAGEKN